MPHLRQNSQQIVKETPCWQRRSLVEKLVFAIVFLAAIAILAVAIQRYVLNLLSDDNYTKLAEAKELQNAQSTEQPGPIVHSVYVSSPKIERVQISPKIERVMELFKF